MNGETVINARHLSEHGPIWMLYEQLRARPDAGRLRLIVSSRDTAGRVLEALRDCGLRANLDPIGDEFHILCRCDGHEAQRVREWLAGTPVEACSSGTGGAPR
jgi:hypothetical protein